MKRHYFVSKDLDAVEEMENDLMSAGIPEHQIHVLSNSETELEIHHLHPVADFMKTNVIHGGLQGLFVGSLVAIVIVLLTDLMGWSQQIGWMPFLFLAIVVVGFCTWEGGFLGFQQQNSEFRRFQVDLRNNRHVLFVDVEPAQEQILDGILKTYSNVMPAGEGAAMPSWIIAARGYFRDFVRWAP